MKNRTFFYRVFFYRGYLQGLFVALLVCYAWFFPDPLIWGTWPDRLADTTGVASLTLGLMLRIWAVSHAGRHTRSRKIKAPLLITTGPYSCVRNPIYLGNFLIGFSLVVLAEALALIPCYVVVFVLQYRKIVEQEEIFLKNKFGDAFERYCETVPRWLPRLKASPRALTFGPNFYFKELGTTCGFLFGAFVLEWMESPYRRVVTSFLRQLGRISKL